VWKFYRKICWVVHDLLFINFALILSLILRFGQDWAQHFYEVKELLIYFSISYIVFAVMFKLHKRLWRYISINDLFLIAWTVTAAMIISLLYLNLVIKLYIPLSVKVLTWFFSLAFIGGSKLVWRLHCEKKSGFKMGRERILIVGAGDSGEEISREIIRRPDLGELIGFVDDDREKIGKKIHDKLIFGSVKEINYILEKEQINSVIIAIPTARGKQIKRIVNNIKNKKVEIKILPGLYELANGKVSVSRIRSIRIEDLLGREPVNLNLEKISGYLKDKRVMVTLEENWHGRFVDLGPRV